MAVTDTVSVMRRGEMTATVKTVETSPEQLAELMVGRRVLLRLDKAPARTGDPMLELDGVSLTDERGVTMRTPSGSTVSMRSARSRGGSAIPIRSAG